MKDPNLKKIFTAIETKLLQELVRMDTVVKSVAFWSSRMQHKIRNAAETHDSEQKVPHYMTMRVSVYFTLRLHTRMYNLYILHKLMAQQKRPAPRNRLAGAARRAAPTYRWLGGDRPHPRCRSSNPCSARPPASGAIWTRFLCTMTIFLHGHVGP